jgi:hypothetical protein
MVRFVGALEADADSVRHQAEVLRRLKYRPTGGFIHRSPSGDVSGKHGVGELADACRPVIAVCESPPEEVEPGDALALDVHVVSDLRSAIDGAEVTATVSWTGGSHTWRWTGDVPADDCVRVGTISLVVPDVPGPLTIDVAIDDLVNRYTSSVSGS